MATKLIGDHIHHHHSNFDCVHSKMGHSSFLKTLLKEEDVVQLKNLAITSLPNHKDLKVMCTDPVFGDRFFYLGSLDGTYSFDKQFNIKDPHFFLHNKYGKKFNIDAVGKFYPCSNEGIDEENAILQTIGSSTVLKVLKNIQFGASWPQTSMSDHGNPIGNSWIYEIEKNMNFSEHKEWITTFEGPSKVKTDLRDDDLVFRLNSNSKPHRVRGHWIIQRNKWEVTFSLLGSHWRRFVRDFFPRKMPLQGFEIEKLGKALPRIIYEDLWVSS